MVPALWVELERLPITANGKINTRALPAPEKVQLSTNEFIAPRNKVEEKLTAIWQKILKVDTIGMNDNFFSMGGHSLTALRIVSTIKKEMGVELMIKQLFLNPTLGKLAAYIQGKANEYSLNASHFKSLVQIKKGTDKLPLYIVCGWWWHCI
jgi:acyl carrier protein